MRRPDVPRYAKAAAGLTADCALSPMDLIPDFTLVLGYWDDLLLLPLLILLSIWLIPPAVMGRVPSENQDPVAKRKA